MYGHSPDGATRLRAAGEKSPPFQKIPSIKIQVPNFDQVKKIRIPYLITTYWTMFLCDMWMEMKARRLLFHLESMRALYDE